MIREAAKAFARQVPAIDAIIRQRNDLLREVALLRTERDTLSTERDTLSVELQNAFRLPPRREGTGSTPPMSRIDKILSAIDRSMRVLEIGPSYDPAAPKSAGWNSFVFDHATQAELQEKYAALGIPTSNIESVDFVWRGGPIETAIPKDMHGSFSACITSHVIEHIPDPISLFRSLDRLLAPDGVVSLAVPDKRFCFDFFRPLTVAPAWIEAFDRKATRHSRRAILEQCSYSAHNGDRGAWGQERAELALHLVSDLVSAKAASDNVGMSDDSPYFDCHAWCFTPSSFDLLLLDLGALGLVDFRIEEIFPTTGCEFFVTLRKRKLCLSAQAVQDRRMELLRAMVNDLAEQAIYMNRQVLG
jgi:SAM-dependent methyltransferase